MKDIELTAQQAPLALAYWLFLIGFLAIGLILSLIF